MKAQSAGCRYQNLQCERAAAPTQARMLPARLKALIPSLLKSFATLPLRRPTVLCPQPVLLSSVKVSSYIDEAPGHKLCSPVGHNTLFAYACPALFLKFRKRYGSCALC